MAHAAETREHKELCFGSGHWSLLRNRQTEKGALKEGTERWGGQREGPGKDGCQLFLQRLHLRLLGASLHPALPPSSSAAAQGLLQQRKTPLMVQTERSVCVLRTESLSLETVYEFTLHLPYPRSRYVSFQMTSFLLIQLFSSLSKPPLSILDCCCHAGLFGPAFKFTFN